MTGLPRKLAAGAVVVGATVLGLTVPAHGSDGVAPPLPPAAASPIPTYRPAPAPSRLVACTKDSADRIEQLTGGLRTLDEILLRECAHHTIQAAVDAVRLRGSTIYVLPGRYHQQEITIRGDATSGCAHCDLQLEGTGARPEDVVVEGGYTRRGDWAQQTGIHAEHANGLYLRNLTTQSYGGAGVEIVSTDGFVIDRVIGRWNGMYGLVANGDDHGVLADCAAAGNSGMGITTASAPGLGGARLSVEVRRCRSYGNLIGYAGGDSVYVHENDIVDNAVGISADSAAWQSHGSFIANQVHGNNADPYRQVWSGRCARPPRDRRGVVCPAVAVPVGTGLLLAGGDENTYAGNLVYDNWRYGFGQLGLARGNRYLGNLMGFDPAGTAVPNGLDFWWDETGERNCWQDNSSAWGGVRSDPQQLPDCAHPSVPGMPGLKSAVTGVCGSYAPATPSAPRGRKPAGCPWLDTLPRPAPPGLGDAITRPRGSLPA